MKLHNCEKTCEFYDEERSCCTFTPDEPSLAGTGTECPLGIGVVKEEFDPWKKHQLTPEPDPDSFCGAEVNMDSMRTLAAVRTHAREVFRLVPPISYTESVPNIHNRAAYCELRLPKKKTVRNHLSDLFSLCDRVLTESDENGTTLRFQVDNIYTLGVYLNR